MRSLPCPICSLPGTETILALEAMPLFSNVLHETRRAAVETERAPMQLDYCARCSFVYNAIFEPGRLKYGRNYENDLSVSPHFREYATHLADELIQRYKLRNSDIIEIGCGDGHFLELICDLGDSRGIGFDPSYDAHRAHVGRNGSRVKIVPDVYSPQYGQCRADLVCCRQVLEHIHDPLVFLRNIRGTIEARDDCVLFFEVPNGEHTFLRGAIWDILYEHCNYFTAESLVALFAAAGFRTLRIHERYDGQFLTIEAHPTSRPRSRDDEAALEHTDVQDALGDFQRHFYAVVDSWRTRIAAWRAQGRQIVLWGSGTKGATFLNVLGLSCDTLGHVVDIHPRKQGRFIPGTGQEIIPPEALAQCRPDVIIVMNPVYLGEIRTMARRYTNDVAFVTASSAYTPVENSSFGLRESGKR